MPKQKVVVFRKSKTDPGIPNLRVQKEKLLRQVERHKKLTEPLSQPPQKKKKDKSRSLESFVKAATLKQQDFEEKQKESQDVPDDFQSETQRSKC